MCTPPRAKRMTSMQVSSAVKFLLLCGFIAKTQAYEQCNIFFICEDNGVEIGYCCGSTLSPRCCYYYAWYSLWYVWVAVSIGIFLFLTCICAIAAKKQKATGRTVVRNQVAAVAPAIAISPGIQNYGYSLSGTSQHQWMHQNPSSPYVTEDNNLYSNNFKTIY